VEATGGHEPVSTLDEAVLEVQLVHQLCASPVVKIQSFNLNKFFIQIIIAI
jgi:hypothetical protein